MSSPLHEFQELGFAPEQAQRALRLLASDGCNEDELLARSRRLLALDRACGSLQNAKLAYSLISRSGLTLDDDGTRLLCAALRHCECVPAAVKLWKTAQEVGATEQELLTTAARLGGDGAEQVKILDLLRRHQEWSPTVAELARQLVAPGWHAEGSWGARPDPERGLVWWDFAVPGQRQPYGMSLTSDPIDLSQNVGTKLRFECRLQITGVTDRCHLELTTDEKKWVKLCRFEGEKDWHTQEVDLHAYDGATVRLRFQVLSGGQREGRGFEMATPRLRTVPISYRVPIEFGELGEGWQLRADGQRTASLSGHQSESPQESLTSTLRAMECPTLTFEARMIASSVYANASVEALDVEGQTVAKIEPSPGSEWSSYRQPLPHLDGLKMRLWSRFNPRREEDGLWVRGLSVLGGYPDSSEVSPLDGGGEDGSQQRKALLELLQGEDLTKLETLSRLRAGLPSLASALALLPMVRHPQHVPVLLHLFSVLKEEAVPSFSLLQDLASEGDLGLQCQVLLTSGLENYASTRDYLGDGLLTPAEFESNCRLYLTLREKWTEESARAGLSLILTPVAEESMAERLEVFESLVESLGEPAELFSAWETRWAS